MTEAVLDIKQWGNSLGVRLPAGVARRNEHLRVDQRVRIRWKVGTWYHADHRYPAHPRATIGALRSGSARR